MEFDERKIIENHKAKDRAAELIKQHGGNNGAAIYITQQLNAGKLPKGEEQNLIDASAQFVADSIVVKMDLAKAVVESYKRSGDRPLG